MSGNPVERHASVEREDSGQIESLREQVACLAALVERQQATAERQQCEIEVQRAQIDAQQAQLSDLGAARVTGAQRQRARAVTRDERGELPTVEVSEIGEQAEQAQGQASSRRALLKWGGAAAAAATVAFVASERQGAQAHGLGDGLGLVIGSANTGTLQTGLSITGTSTASPFFKVDASASSGSGSPGPIAIGGIANIASNFSAVGVYGSSSAGFGVYGISGSGPGVYGTSTDNFAVEGQSTNSFGVYGSSTNADAVHGEASNGYGVYGFSFSTGVYGEGFSNATGIAGHSTSGVDMSAAGTGRLFQTLQGSTGAPSGGPYSKGEMVRDNNGDMYICVTAGSPGTWKKMAAIPSGTMGGALVLFPAPFRVYDTRPGVGAQGGGGPMSAGQIIVVNITGVVDPSDSSIVVPSGATGIIGDLIAIAPSGAGFLGIQPHTGSHNSQAWVNYTSGVTIHNSVVVGLSGDGKVDIECSAASSGMGLTITGYII